MVRKLIEKLKEQGMHVTSTELSATEHFLRFHSNMQKECYMIGQIEKKEEISTLNVHVRMGLNIAEMPFGDILELIDSPERLAEIKQLYDEVERNKVLLNTRNKLKSKAIVNV